MFIPFKLLFRQCALNCLLQCMANDKLNFLRMLSWKFGSDRVTTPSPINAMQTIIIMKMVEQTPHIQSYIVHFVCISFFFLVSIVLFTLHTKLQAMHSFCHASTPKTEKNKIEISNIRLLMYWTPVHLQSAYSCLRCNVFVFVFVSLLFVPLWIRTIERLWVCVCVDSLSETAASLVQQIFICCHEKIMLVADCRCSSCWWCWFFRTLFKHEFRNFHFPV